MKFGNLTRTVKSRYYLISDLYRYQGICTNIGVFSVMSGHCGVYQQTETLSLSIFFQHDILAVTVTADY